MGFKEFFDYRKRKNLYMVAVAILGLNSLVWTRDIIGSILSFQVFGNIDIATLIGAGALYATYLFYKGRIG